MNNGISLRKNINNEDFIEVEIFELMQCNNYSNCFYTKNKWQTLIRKSKISWVSQPDGKNIIYNNKECQYQLSASSYCVMKYESSINYIAMSYDEMKKTLFG